MKENNENKFKSTPYLPDKPKKLNGYPLAKNKILQLDGSGNKYYLDSETYAGGAKEWASAGLIVTGTILTLPTLALAGTGVGLIVVGTLLPLLWPGDGEETDPKNLKVWKDLMEATEVLIDKKIDAYSKAAAVAALGGLGNLLNEYNIAFERWHNDTNNPRETQNVIKRFDAAYNGFVKEMSSFAIKGHELTLLPVYAQAANLHLLLIRDGIIFADDWNLARSSNAGEYYRDRLSYYTKTYIGHCVDWYNEGNEEYERPISRLDQLYKLIKYQREMTINVLDIISLFSNYNPDIYPVKQKQPKLLPYSELTREIYTDPLNYDNYQFNNMNEKLDLEYQLMRKPHLFTILRAIDLEFLGKNFDNSSDFKDRPFLLGNHNGYTYINDGYNHFANNPFDYKKIKWGNVQGAWGIIDGKQREMILIPDDFKTFLVKTTRYKEEGLIEEGDLVALTYKLSMSLTDDVTENNEQAQLGTTNRPLYEIISEVPPKEGTITYENYSHILSYMSSYNKEIWLQTSVFAWTHAMVNFENEIEEDVITQIKAVKSYKIVDDGKVIKGPGHTGGDLVKLNQYATMFFAVKFNSDKKYAIRLRYAAHNNTTVELVLPDNSRIAGDLVSTFSHSDEESLKYEDFNYAAMPYIIKGNSSSRTVFAIYCKKESIIIDKIEFIPIK
ncbi:insecticidal delta-endotoxin Cry8Ea1 family protein [Clostridium sp. Marseille-Q2269]|uniref:insecticidal delta-endotoxin Cry8Ea1 family protein n=1 Tax=Clostridium sp. Marseille-Q2269 TaxID=2942205 RepID=UPI0020741A5D|nr:insecticidal delta-endotoxin Cry8Ea1 family protein [Clostridium sp. Marseille-Q2269]